MWGSHWLLAILLFLVIGLPSFSAFAEEEKTPEAGKEFRTTLFGEEIYVPPRDRRSVTAVNFGINWIPNGPSQEEVLPFGALYVWRNWDKENRRFRGTFPGVVNDLDYRIGLPSLPNWSLIFTLNNFIAPIGRSEYVEGQRIRESELEWNYAFAGFGFRYRVPFNPFKQGSALQVFLTYEPGFRWFSGTNETSPQYRVISSIGRNGDLLAHLKKTHLKVFENRSQITPEQESGGYVPLRLCRTNHDTADLSIRQKNPRRVDRASTMIRL